MALVGKIQFHRNARRHQPLAQQLARKAQSQLHQISMRREAERDLERTRQPKAIHTRRLFQLIEPDVLIQIRIWIVPSP